MTNLPLTHKQQEDTGYCLAACAQMVLAYSGVTRTQSALARTMGFVPQLGIPYSNLEKLRSARITIDIAEGDFPAIEGWLSQQIPVIAFVNAGDLSHWRTETSTNEVIIQHAVVVVGIEAQTIFIHDPNLDQGPIAIPEAEFMLAWSWMDTYYAILQVK